MPSGYQYFIKEEATDSTLLEGYAADILTDVCAWAQGQMKVKSKINFHIDVEKMSANASFNYDQTLVSITSVLISNIYRDCMIFPLYNDEMSLQDDSAWLKDNIDENLRYYSDDAIPEVVEESASKFVRCKTNDATKKYAVLIKDYPFLKKNIERNTLLVRFTMFELTLIWIFFHEVSHFYQSHDVIKQTQGMVSGVERDDDVDCTIKLSQAREILADIQAMDLSLAYLKRDNSSVSPETYYLLHCGISLLFHNLYTFSNGVYNKSLNSDVKHPNPVVRAQFSRGAFISVISKSLEEQESDEFAREIMGLTYLSLKALICSGIYWSQERLGIEDYKTAGFIYHSSDEQLEVMHEVMYTLADFIEIQFEAILANKRNENNNMDLISEISMRDFIKAAKRKPFSE